MTSAGVENQETKNGAKQSTSQAPCICNNVYRSKVINKFGRLSSGITTTTLNGLKTAKDRGADLYGTTVRSLGKGAGIASNHLLKESERVENLQRNSKK